MKRLPTLLLFGLSAVLNPAVADDKPAFPSPDELESSGAIIGAIILDKQNVFDLSIEAENNALYRLANRWHIITRDPVVLGQLLFQTGDRYAKRKIEETERILRQNVYFYDAKIEPVRYENGVVDLRVRTRDLWTLMPGFSISRSGGENRTKVSLSERNLLGLGVTLRLGYSDDVDRESFNVEYFDRNLGQSWTSLRMRYADNSDGDRTDVRLIRPFYELDARWAAGGTLFDETREERFYDLGEEAAEYGVDRSLHTAFFGRSAGLKDGWATRWSAGLVYDENRFFAVTDSTLPDVLPEDRKLVYPFVSVEMLEDRYESTANRDQMERTEDFFMGARLFASVGYANEDFGADRESLIYRMEASRGFGSIQSKALLVNASFSGRIDEGSSSNQLLALNARYYNPISEKSLFYMTFDAVSGNNLDLDSLVELGGDNGLRGYPLRYQTGDSRLLLTMEQRYFTDWYPFRLFRIGGAVFADIGRVWGDSPVGGEQLGWLKDVGIGLRLVPTRASGRDIIHVDIAFPLDGDPSIDNVQFVIESKRSF